MSLEAIFAGITGGATAVASVIRALVELRESTSSTAEYQARLVELAELHLEPWDLIELEALLEAGRVRDTDPPDTERGS